MLALRPTFPQAYGRAIQRAVERAKAADGEAHVLDIGCGSGVLSLLAAKAGAKSVVRNTWAASAGMP